jgi:calcium/calmodulin-dependent protein kinase (CaM kinase) II
MNDTTRDELLRLSQRLLDSITGGDWQTYCELCDPSLTAFEPEARGQCVEGLAFHRFYFDMQRRDPLPRNTITAPQVRLLGEDVALLTYVRLVQWVGEDGASRTERFEETRLWQRQQKSWRHVHFHRSANP